LQFFLQPPQAIFVVGVVFAIFLQIAPQRVEWTYGESFEKRLQKKNTSLPFYKYFIFPTSFHHKQKFLKFSKVSLKFPTQGYKLSCSQALSLSLSQVYMFSSSQTRSFKLYKLSSSRQSSASSQILKLYKLHR